MEDRYMAYVKVFKAFCDENRLYIIELLKDGDKCACVLLEKLSIVQSTLSHHMKILCESGVVSSRQEGKWTHYSLDSEGCEHAMRLMAEYTASACKKQYVEVPVNE